MLSTWDSLFYSPSPIKASIIDPAWILQLLPYRFFVAEYWHHGLPLWNELQGVGMPLLGDPQACVFSPIFAIFNLLPSMQTWNLLLIMLLIFGTIFTYLFSLELEFGYTAGLVAALLFAFCPGVQWRLEAMGTGICLTPFVFFCFLRAGKNKSPWNVVLAGIAAAIDILSAHPEIAFTTITIATLLMWLVIYQTNKTTSLRISAVRKTVLIGTIALGLSALIVFPFLEYLLNGESYKFGLTSDAPTGILWQALIANYCFPFFSKGSPFMGPLSWLGIPMLLFFPDKFNRFEKPLLICFVVTTFALCKLFPMNLMLQIPPLSLTAPIYCLPPYILFIAVLSGIGISKIVNINFNNSLPKVFGVLILGIAFSVIPLIVFKWYSNGGTTVLNPIFDSPKFDFKLWLRNIFFAAAMFFCSGLTIKMPHKWKIIGCGLVIAIGIGNLIPISYASLPVRQLFNYPRVLPLKLQADNESRILSIGDHLFEPNTNLVYGVPMVQVSNPIRPKGYIELMKACGARADDTILTFSPRISKLVDLLNVRTIISESPILDENAIPKLDQPIAIGEGKSQTNEIVYDDALSLNNIRLLRDHRSNTLYCCMDAIPKIWKGVGFRVCCNIRDVNERLVTTFEPQPIYSWLGKQRITCSGALPLNLKYWTFSLQIISDENASPIDPTHIAAQSLLSDHWLLLVKSNQANKVDDIINDRFVPISRCGSIVSYRNKTALDRYFLARKIVWADGIKEALKYLQLHPLELSSTVVLDNAQKEQFQQLTDKMCIQHDNSSTASFDASARINKLNSVDSNFASALDLEVKSTQPALLVVSDLFYPGWKAILDGKDEKIFRADYFFRAILIPAGRHHLRFEYKPLSFTIALLLFLSTITIIVICWLRLKLFRKVTTDDKNLVPA